MWIKGYLKHNSYYWRIKNESIKKIITIACSCDYGSCMYKSTERNRG